MIGSLDPNIKEAEVIGGGIAGLLAAYRLLQLGYDVSVFEKSDRVGGLIQTDHLKEGLSEWAAHSLMVSPIVSSFCEEIGLPMIEANPAHRARYIFRNGKMRKMPLGPIEIARTAKKALFAQANGVDSLTVEDWAKRHLGEAALNYILAPFLTGIYAARPSEIDVRAAFPRLEVPSGRTLLGARLFGSPEFKDKRARSKMMAPEKGMGDLVSRLQKRLEGRIHTGQEIRELQSCRPGVNRILSVPAPVAAQLLKTESPDLADGLASAQYAPLVSVSLFIKGTIPKEGVGVLIPREEAFRILGVLFNSSSFAKRSSAELNSLTVMLGGTSDPAAVDLSDQKLGEIIQEEVSKLFSKSIEIVSTQIHRYPAAIPLYSKELRKLWDLAGRTWCARKGNLLFGSYTGDVSVRGMIECTMQTGLQAGAK